MKIGILSMQRIINNGSFLQAYALMRIVESMGHDVEFVDFKISDNKKERLPLKELLRINHLYIFCCCKIMEGFLFKGIKGAKFAISTSRVSINFMNNYMKDIGLRKKPNYCSKVKILLFGSDEVFNTIQYVQRNKGHAWQLYGADNNAEKLVSYAASFGHTTYEGLQRYGMLEKTRRLLAQFETISVRDENSLNIIKKITKKDACIHIDPVLLYEFDDIEIKKPKITNYILIYSYPGRINIAGEIEVIKSFAKKYGKKIICVNMMQGWEDEIFYEHPFDLLGYFKYADYIVTDTFHGAVISIKYNKKFVSFVRDSTSYSNKQKVGFLLKMFNLKKREVRDIGEFEKCMLDSVDYDDVNKKLDEEKEKALKYLTKILQ